MTPHQHPDTHRSPVLGRRRLLGLAAAGAGAAMLGAPAAAAGVDRRRGRIKPTIGGGSLERPATGPGPAFRVAAADMVLVKNWDFGHAGTITGISSMNQQFQYHDQFGTIGNGTNYGAVIVAPDAANALPGQPIQDPNNPVRTFHPYSMRTYLVPLNGATTVSPTQHNAGSGSFQAKWTAPNGGSLLGRDLLWETRVRYVTPPYFWFAIWTCGNIWQRGAEIDVVESFGYDNGGGYTNYDGRYWHSGVIGGTNSVYYHADWGAAMASRGITSFDGSQYHVWQCLYKADDTYEIYVDGILVQWGVIHWTVGGAQGAEPINMSFIFDGGWGHTKVASVNHPLPASELQGKYYEWDYSRIYMSA
ncbi:hypothetical protein E1262_15650 [Jiangella aurantiaca]|uniref:GH16 domain-containing protein n=1 Tax=Jiangella aurantiaca TaxID=2530373 RepID=A0A4R5A8C3_9ACTN|nr:hypothetical protein [Jiangella aurantiaca]TDD68458.1 hypothetical protein E1262_15650 [Jiangella aurantiaca]